MVILGVAFLLYDTIADPSKNKKTASKSHKKKQVKNKQKHKISNQNDQLNNIKVLKS